MVDDILSEYQGLEMQLSDPELHNDPAAARKVGKRFSELQPIIQTHQRLTQAKDDREAALEMSARELEKQVNELKQENERLRSENDWLRRLIMSRPEALPGFFNVINNASGSANNSSGNRSSPMPLPPFDSTMQAIVQHASTANREHTRGL